MEWDAYSDGELVASNVGFIGWAGRGGNTELAEYGYRARLVSSDAMAEVLSVPCGDVVVYDLVGRLLYVGERMPEGGAWALCCKWSVAISEVRIRAECCWAKVVSLCSSRKRRAVVVARRVAEFLSGLLLVFVKGA